jgi:phosphoglycerate dehydrogenase-like enzyme
LCPGPSVVNILRPGVPAAAARVRTAGRRDGCPRLQRIVSPSAGREHHPVVVPAGVSLEFSTFHGKIMAETVLGMMLCHARGLMRARLLQTGEEPWPRRGSGPEYFRPADRLLPADELEAELPGADHLVLCLPVGVETDRILDGRRLALLPAQAGIYNVGRGNAIDEEALAELLRELPGAEAYLDVFAEEPLAETSPLRGLPNCLVLPHLSPNAPEFMDLFVEELIGRLQSASG